jgi:plasmid stabilization system protein ParE
MARRLLYAPRARDDLDAVRTGLTQPGSGPAAKRRLAAIRAEIRRLQHYPCMAAFGEHPGVRELPCDGGYRVMHELRPDTGDSATAGDVRVLRVFGPGQDRSAL